MNSDDISNKIIQLGKKEENLQELFQMLSREAMFYYCPCDFNNLYSKVKLNKNDYIVIGTSKEIINKAKQYMDFRDVKEVDAIRLIKNILSMEIEGVIINLGDESQLVLSKEMLKLLYREIVAIELYMKGGAYVIEKNKDFLFVELDQMKFLNIALTETEGEELKKELKKELKQNGEVTFKIWKEILNYFVITKCNGLVYSLSNKDVTFIKDPYLAWLYDSPFQI